MAERNYTLSELKLIEKVKEENTTCYYCGDSLKSKGRTIDHKIPISRGGQTTLDNLVVSCKRCNEEKGMMNYEEYLSFLEKFRKYIDEDINFNELKDIKTKYQGILDRHKELCEKHRLIGCEVRKVQDIIMVMKMNAADGYILARDLQKLLNEQNEIKKQKESIAKLRDMAINQVNEISKNMTALADTVRNNYRNDVIRSIRYK